MSEPSIEQVFIFCDSPRHPKRVAVTNFRRLLSSQGRWNEHYTSPFSGSGKRESGTTLVDDAIPEKGMFSRNQRVSPDRVRSRYVLECRKCRGMSSVPVREEKLFAVLNKLSIHGVSEISLTGLAASVASIST